MKLLTGRYGWGWVMYGILGSGNKWFFGFSKNDCPTITDGPEADTQQAYEALMECAQRLEGAKGQGPSRNFLKRFAEQFK